MSAGDNKVYVVVTAKFAWYRGVFATPQLAQRWINEQQGATYRFEIIPAEVVRHPGGHHWAVTVGPEGQRLDVARGGEL